MIPDEKVTQILERQHGLELRLQDPAKLSREEFADISRDYAAIGPVAAAAQKVKELRAEIDDLEAIIDDRDAESEMKALAEEELIGAKRKLSDAEGELSVLLIPKDEADDRSAILEIRAGTGGDEAALFAGDLFRMYQRYAEAKGWKLDLISASAGEVGGYKEVIASVGGRGVFARLKYESGVHRVQRVPVTESSGRIHTSAATVAVLPEPEDVDIQIADNDLRIDVYRSSGPGGQSVNTTDSAVRITHLPTGIVVQQQDEKSQHKNRAKAMKILRARLYEHERERVESERAETRKGMVGSGDRSERIRTYNFPQGRVTDHRISLTLHKLDQVLEGAALDELIDALIAEHQAEEIAHIESEE